MASSDANSPYRLGHLPKVAAQIKELSSQAKEKDLYGAFVDALNWVMQKLRKEPSTWGDPLYPANKEGGMVYRGLRIDLVVHYVVYEIEKVVMILDVKHVG